MIRIIDGVAYMRKTADTFTVRARELGNGHFEATAVRDGTWEELEWTRQQIADHLEMVEKAMADEDWSKERKAKLLKIAANRAKTRVRHLCKAMGADTLLTLTYRACETDLARVKRDLKEFNRRMLRELPGFRFVGAFEKQARGAYHVHMATAGIPKYFVRKAANGAPSRVKSYDLLRAVWRSVTKDRQGNIDVARRKRHSMSTPARIASYISKYISKEFAAGEPYTNRYTKYGDFEVPQVINLGTVGSALEAVEVVYSLLGSRVVFNQGYSRFGDWFFLHGETMPPAVLVKGP